MIVDVAFSRGRYQKIKAIYTLLTRLVQKYFYVSKFAPGSLLLALSCLNSVESEIATRKLLLLGRLISEQKMSPAVKSLFDSRTKSFFGSDIT